MFNLGPVIGVIIAIATALGLALGFGGAELSSSPTSQVATQVSKEQALEIALKDAGLTKNQVRVDFGDPEFDVDNGRDKWEIDFALANNPRAEYEYEIDATTGAIIKAEKPRNVQPAPAISQERALEIALEHAGLTAADAEVVHIERDRERGVNVWDVDFRSGAYEYDYDINIDTGEIVKFEKDSDLF